MSNKKSKDIENETSMSSNKIDGPNVLNPRYLSKNDAILGKILKFKNYNVKLVGTGGIESQQYPADIDLLCVIDSAPKTAQDIKKEFSKILSNVEKVNNLFFIEFKLQNEKRSGGKEPEKFKFFNFEDVKGDFFEKHYDKSLIDFCKIDLVSFSGGVFKDVSCIYFFDPPEMDKNVFLERILQDQKERYDEGKYYKSLKRFMLACKLQSPPNTNVIIGLTNFFNSEVGKVYQKDNYISACLNYIKKYGIDDRVKMFIKNMGLGNMPASDLEKVSNEYKKIYNEEAKKVYDTHDIPVGFTLPFVKKRMTGMIGGRNFSFWEKVFMS